MKRWPNAFHGYQSPGSFELYIKIYKPRFELYYSALSKKLRNKDTNYFEWASRAVFKDTALQTDCENLVRNYIFEPLEIDSSYKSTKTTVEAPKEAYQFARAIE